MALRVHWLPRFGQLMLAEIKPRQVQSAINELARVYRSSSLRTYYGTLRSLFVTPSIGACLVGLRAVRSKLPALVQDEKRVVGPEELHRLADGVGPEWRSLILLGGVMGLRFGEAVALRVRDLDLTVGEVSISRTISELVGRLSIGPSKTGAGVRSLAIPGPLVAELESHLSIRELVDTEALLFGDRNGRPIRRSNFARRIFNPAVDRAC